MRLLLSIFLLGFCPTALYSQSVNDSSVANYAAISNKTLNRLNSSYELLNASMKKQSLKLLAIFQKRESKLKNQLQSKDSTKSQQFFSNSQPSYTQLSAGFQNIISNPTNLLRNYMPGVDSMKTAIAFLTKTGLPIDKLKKLQEISLQLKQLQCNFQNANDIQQYVTQRTAQLNSLLSNYGFSKQLSGLSKNAFYYQQQLTQYKGIINDKQKQEQLVLSAVRQVPAFQNFWRKNSMLAQLFPAPGNSGTPLAGIGLQTNAQVAKLIQGKLGTNKNDDGANASQFLQQQVSGAQGQINQLKDKLNRLNMSGGNSSMVMPDFSPNPQKQKSLLKRLELGFNIKNTSSNSLLPAISSLGLSVGYKLSDKATIGIGLNYLLGLGNSISHVHFSNQGVGLRSYMDIKAKGSIWITGGYEYNYVEQFATFNSIKNLQLWQKSALIGVMKKYTIGKKSGNIQLLYDFLANQKLPRGQALAFRFGFGL